MKNKDRKAINEIAETAFQNIAESLEGDRHYPSVREAGDAPTDSACDDAYKAMTNAIVEICDRYGFELGGVFEPPSCSSIIRFCESIEFGEHTNLIDEFKGSLEEIDEFDHCNSNEKYRYISTVYRHIDSDTYFCVTVQYSRAGNDIIYLNLHGVEHVIKKEIKTYEWSGV